MRLKRHRRSYSLCRRDFTVKVPLGWIIVDNQPDAAESFMPYLGFNDGFATRDQALQAASDALVATGQLPLEPGFQVYNVYAIENTPVAIWRTEAGWQLNCLKVDDKPWQTFQTVLSGLVFATLKEAQTSAAEFIEYYKLEKPAKKALGNYDIYSKTPPLASPSANAPLLPPGSIKTWSQANYIFSSEGKLLKNRFGDTTESLSDIKKRIQKQKLQAQQKS